LGEVPFQITVGAVDPGYTTPMEDVSRAAKNLIETHGKNAAQVAERRAVNADVGGSGASAHIWRQIATAVREMQGVG
jgi:hypothetical protein